VPPSARSAIDSGQGSIGERHHPAWDDSSAPTECAAWRTARHHRRAGPRPVGRGRARARPRPGDVPGAPAQGRRRARPAGLGGVPRRMRSSPVSPRPGVDVFDAGVLPTPAVAFLTADTRRRPRGDALGVAQPDARQRHQVLRNAGDTSSTTRSRTRSRPRCASRGRAPPARTSAGSWPLHRRPTGPLRRATSCACCRTGSTGSHGRHRRATRGGLAWSRREASGRPAPRSS
jgi:hypothetical protein